MTPTKTPEALIQDLLTQEKLAVLSTCHDNRPYSSLVAFAAAADLSQLIFLTAETTRKYTYLEANRHVSLLITNSRNQEADFHQAIALTVTGSAHPVDNRVKEQEGAAYLRKHPHMKDFLRAETTRLVQVVTRRLILVQRFQDVVELEMGK